MINFSNVSFRYENGKPENGVQNIDLQINAGEMIIICGESGCGKTTLTRMINGLIPHYYEGEFSGEISIKGKAAADLPLHEIAKDVGSVFQNPKAQFFNVDTSSEIVFGCENMGLPEAELFSRLERVSKEFRLESLLNRSLFTLSGGEKQRIACASVSASDPAIIVLDEPSANLDTQSIMVLQNIAAAWKSAGKTIVVAEHRLHYLIELADRILYMKDGQIKNIYTRDEFLSLDETALHRFGLRSLQHPIINLSPHRSAASLSMHDFRFAYKNKETVLNIPELKLPANQVIGILGDNGAGKTTFARCLCGLEKIPKSILHMGMRQYSSKARLRACYMVMQDVNHQLFAESVIDELLLSMDSGDQNNAETILRSLNLWDKRERHPMSLSGGEKQRVAIAGALACNKELLIFDEPTSGLDYRHMREVADCILALRDKGKHIFVITHDPELILHCCTYILYIENGLVKQHGNLV